MSNSAAAKIFGAFTMLTLIVGAVWWALSVLTPLVPSPYLLQMFAVWVLVTALCVIISLAE